MNEALANAFISQLKNGVLSVVENNLRLVFLFKASCVILLRL